MSVRWGHIKLVENLLKLEWSQDYLKNALKEALERKNEALIKMIKKTIAEKKNKKKKSNCSCFI